MENREDTLDGYVLTDQIGHILRRATQRHTAIFSKRIPKDLTPTRFAALAVLGARGAVSQNALGRDTAMDIATIKGVVDRLAQMGLVSIGADPNDARRNMISLTEKGQALLAEAVPAGIQITTETMAPLSAQEQDQLIALLRKIA